MAYILYHGNCYDGTGAAWAVLKGLSGQGHLEFIACQYGQPMPTIPDHEDVYIVDFSYPEEQLRSLARRSHAVTLLDHHKTAQKDLAGLLEAPEPNLEVVFNMNHSGAYLAWKHMMSEEVPQLILYIEDRDIWKKQLPYTDEINTWIQSYERTFENYDMLSKIFNTVDDRLPVALEGVALLRFQKQKVREICDQARLQSLGGYDNIPVVNATVFVSEVGNELLNRYPESKFAAYYLDRADGIRQWGLRSRRDFDCSVVAKSFGGGGHAQASGFQEEL